MKQNKFNLTKSKQTLRFPRVLKAQLESLPKMVRRVAMDAIDRIVTRNARCGRKKTEIQKKAVRRAFFDTQHYEDRFGWDATKAAWDWLLHNVIESDHEFFHFAGKEGKCRDIWFKSSITHQNDLDSVKIENRERDTANINRLSEYTPAQQYGIKCHQQLRYTGHLFGELYEADKTHIEKINNGSFVPAKASRSNRIYTPAVCLMGENKQFLKHISGKELVNVDVRQMHPTILKDVMDEELYPDANKVSSLYETIMTTLGIDRDAAKREVCKGLNYGTKHGRQVKSKLFKVLENSNARGVIMFLDDNNWSVWELFESYETRSMEVLLTYAQEKGIFLVPQHDGFLCFPEHADELKKVLNDAYRDMFSRNSNAGLTFKTEKLTPKEAAGSFASLKNGTEGKGKANGDIVYNNKASEVKKPISEKMAAYLQRLIITRFFEFEPRQAT